MDMLCSDTLNLSSFLTDYVFGSCFRTLAVNLVLDFLVQTVIGCTNVRVWALFLVRVGFLVQR